MAPNGFVVANLEPAPKILVRVFAVGLFPKANGRAASSENAAVCIKGSGIPAASAPA